MSDKTKLEDFMSRYLALSKKCKAEDRMIFNHVCIRVEDIDAAEELLCSSFGIDAFLRPGGETFDDEKEFRVAWLDDNNMYLEVSEFTEEQKIGYDTGVGQPIGHLSEVGFFVPDMDKALDELGPKGWQVTSSIETEGARMFKINNKNTAGLPVELIDFRADKYET